MRFPQHPRLTTVGPRDADGLLGSALRTRADQYQPRKGKVRSRRLLRAREVAVAAAMLVGLSACMSDEPAPRISDVGFTQPLAIPPLAESHQDAEGRRVFDLTAQAGTREFVSGRTSETWGFNGAYLGPTLRAERGERVVINVHNELDEATTVHWHGMHLPARADGGPHQLIEPGGTWTPTWQIDQPAATLWYHPHPHGETEHHVRRGLAGMFILDDEQEAAALDLPRRYGFDDIPVIVQDQRLGDGGGEQGPTGRLGDTIVVNGTVGPYLEVTTEHIRLRLLNASTARMYSFGFSDDRSFALIATDGGLLEAPYEATRIQLAPGERAEIVLAMRPGDVTRLHSYPPELGTRGAMTKMAGGDDSFDVLELRAAASIEEAPPIPDRLVDIPRLEAEDAAEIREFELSGRQINGKSMDPDRIDEVVTRGTTEIWEVVNRHGQPHSFHVHDVQFQILSVDGAPPPAYLSGWKDTIYLPPRVPTTLIMRFTDYADPDFPYMYHCHLLAHEDKGMMGQFVVIEPGQAAGRPPDGHQHHGTA